MFSDQVRLAFFEAKADRALAVVNLVVWCILMVELLFEVFIRPDGYQDLIISDKAYAPTTVRYINAFHLVIESISLLCFIPEFYCLFSDYACDDRLNFSFFNAALMGVTGPSGLDFFFGKAFFALIRFRVFGLVRHWKKMWINNTFINMRWKAAHGFFSGSSQKQVMSLKSKHGPHKAKTEQSEDAKKKESVLTNASNIGTALMVTNSYRVLLMLCAIVGIFPALASFSAKTTINMIATEMTQQLQATNLLVKDNSNSSCQFLADSIISWVAGLTPSEGRDLLSADTDVFLLSLEMTPNHCLDWFNGQVNTSVDGPTHILFDVCAFLNNSEAVQQEVSASLRDEEMDEETEAFLYRHCETWKMTGNKTKEEEIANATDIRTGSITVVESDSRSQKFTVYDKNGNFQSEIEEIFQVIAVFNESYAIENA